MCVTTKARICLNCFFKFLSWSNLQTSKYQGLLFQFQCLNKAYRMVQHFCWHSENLKIWKFETFFILLQSKSSYTQQQYNSFPVWDLLLTGDGGTGFIALEYFGVLFELLWDVGSCLGQLSVVSCGGVVGEKCPSVIPVPPSQRSIR